MHKAVKLTRDGEVDSIIDLDETPYSYENLKYLSVHDRLCCINKADEECGCSAKLTIVKRKNGLHFRTFPNVEHTMGCTVKNQDKQKITGHSLRVLGDLMEELASGELDISLLEVKERQGSGKAVFHEEKEYPDSIRLTILRNLIRCVAKGDLSLKKQIKEQRIQDLFVKEVDFVPFLHSDSDAYKICIFNAITAGNGNLYTQVMLDDLQSETMFINLQEHVTYSKEKQEVSVAVLLCKNDVTIHEDMPIRTMKLPSSRIVVLKKNQTGSFNIIQKLEMLLDEKLDLFQMFDPFTGGNYLASFYMGEDWWSTLEMISPNVFAGVDEAEHKFRYLKKCIENEEEPEKYLALPFTFSLDNDKTIAYKSVLLDQFVSDNERHKEFHPYLFEFTGRLKSVDQLLHVLDLLHERKSAVFSCQLRYEAFKDIRLDDNSIMMKGKTIFCASSERENQSVLCLRETRNMDDEEKLKQLEEFACPFTYPVHNVKTMIDTVLKGDEPDFLKVYNVGHGNNIVIHTDRKKNIFFDIGMSIFSNEHKEVKVKKTMQEISKVKADMIVLSHWDMDHIKGILQMKRSLDDAIWIVPNVCSFKKKEISSFAVLLFNYLLWKYPDHTIVVEPDNKQEPIYEGFGIHIYPGLLKSSNRKWLDNAKREVRDKNRAVIKIHNTRCNNFGLCMLVENDKKALLMGDCDYQKIPSYVCDTPVEYLVASHHGAHMGQIKKGKETAVICCGSVGSKTYKHPGECTISSLHKIGFKKVKKTQDYMFISINLKKK